MDKGIRSYVPCLLMLILLLGVPLGNLIDDENRKLSQADHQPTSARAQTTWSGVVELTDSYTVNVTDELIIAPCTVVKLPNAARLFVDGRIIVQGDTSCRVTLDRVSNGLHYGIQFNQSSYGRGSVIDNLSIENSMYGITIYGSNPILNNVTVVNPSRVGVDLFSSANPTIRDLLVDSSRYEGHRSRAEPWMRTDPREGEHLPSGQAMGTMDSAAATALHQAGDVLSFQLIQAMSDTLPHDQHYEGPGVHFQQWLRVLDPRTSEKQRKSIMTSLQEKDGVWSEADHASLIRYGEDGRLAARSLNEARGALLNQSRYGGKSGRLVKWYGRSVKWSGNVNETTLYRQVLGPLGLVSNVFSGVSARMALAFTRNGGPPIRGLQSLLVPPAGLGRIPKMFNSRVENYHEVVSLFNEIDQRF